MDLNIHIDIFHIYNLFAQYFTNGDELLFHTKNSMIIVGMVFPIGCK